MSSGINSEQSQTVKVPGTIPKPDPRKEMTPTGLAPAVGGLSVFYSVTGKVYLSVDGAGSNNASHAIRVNKPTASATVRAAYLMAATTWYQSPIPGNFLQLNGTTFPWEASALTSFSSHRGDVTSIVKPVVDAAGVGIVNFQVTEGALTNSIDGEALAVVFDDPTQASSRTIVLLFGAQNPTGDLISITLGEPIDPNAPNAIADMGLGISFSYQASGGNQTSIIDVNGQRLTSAAGGEDDGASSDGALITVGGIGDSNANPVDPNAGPTNPRSDDELYSLLPFITPATTGITVNTLNPSNDDNIFFAHFTLSGSAVVVAGEGITLSPPNATYPLGANHTVTATVVDLRGPLVGAQVNFNILSGPNVGRTWSAFTNLSGQATFTYQGTGGVGTDQIQATYSPAPPTSPALATAAAAAAAATIESNIVTCQWISVFDLSFQDDNGRSLLCLDSTSGRWRFEVLLGPYTGVYTGQCTLQNSATVLKVPIDLKQPLRMYGFHNITAKQAAFTLQGTSGGKPVVGVLFDTRTDLTPPVCGSRIDQAKQ